MNELKQFKNLYPTTQLMLVSLALGTLLLVIHLVLPKNEFVIITGYFYVVLTFLVNLLAAVILIIKLFLNLKEYEMYVIRLLILLANIPIATFYLFITLRTL
ncbi:hypothetical protein [Flavobacterium haoranii]|uniref:Branched-chain amino acid:cation transporter, LIVCS family n=1 Tax=Flavobacterium haoranii TaxID=683124 RepID=A0A1M6L0W8_9FLAO|nr:hypothetical protein [Flavobacterium haoranii]SHJ64766.1 hypothetical protein SAMN05444337_2351 [Flavobacterium haoranii]